MKKIYYLIAMAVMAFTFTSCEDVPEPFGRARTIRTAHQPQFRCRRWHCRPCW